MTAAGKSQTPGNVALHQKQEGAELSSVKQSKEEALQIMCSSPFFIWPRLLCRCIPPHLLICVSPHPLLISICPHINPFISFLSDKRFVFVVFIESMMLSVPSLCRTSSGPLSLHLSALHVPVWLHSVNEI